MCVLISSCEEKDKWKEVGSDSRLSTIKIASSDYHNTRKPFRNKFKVFKSLDEHCDYSDCKSDFIYKDSYLSFKNKWKIKTELKDNVSVFDVKNYIVLGDFSSHVYFFDKRNGKLVKKDDINAPLSSVVCSSDRIVLSNAKSSLRAYSIDLKKMWDFKSGSTSVEFMRKALVRSGSTLVSLNSEGDLLGISTINGEVEWSHLSSKLSKRYALFTFSNKFLFMNNEKVSLMDYKGNLIKELYINKLKNIIVLRNSIFLICEKEVMETDLNNLLEGKFLLNYSTTNEHFFILDECLCSVNKNGNVKYYNSEGIHDFVNLNINIIGVKNNKVVTGSGWLEFSK